MAGKRFLSGVRTDFISITDAPLLGTDGTNKDYVDGRNIDSLVDVDTTTVAPVTSDVLTYDGSNWVPDASGGGVTAEDARIQNGFDDRSASSMSIVDFTRTFSIQPTGASFNFWSGGAKFIASTTHNVVFPDTEGNHYFYFDETGTLTTTTVFTGAIISTYAFVAGIYWDSDNNETILFGDERHGRGDSEWHSWAHLTQGTQWVEGLNLGNITAAGNGDSAEHAQLSVANGAIMDEDIYFFIGDGLPQEISPIAEIPMFYRSGVTGNWRRIAATQYPITTTGGGRAAFNEDTGATWQLTEVTNNDYVLTHIIATTDINHPIIGIVGQDQYTTAANGRSGATAEIHNLALGGLTALAAEWKAIATVLFQTGDGKANAVRSSVEFVEGTADHIDWRSNTTGAGSAAVSVSTHGSLSSLLDDDHPQYHNDTRGDLRYYTQTQLDAALALKSNTDHTHAGSGPSALNDLTDVSGTPTTNQVLTWGGSAWAPADAQGGGGAGGIQEHLDVYGNTNQSIDAGWTDISWGVQREEFGSFTFTAPGTEVTIVDTSTYLVQVSVTNQALSGTSRSESEFDVQIDTGAGYASVPGSDKYIYHRQSSQGKGTASAQFIWVATAGDKIKVRAQRTSGTTTISTLGDGCQFTLIKMTGEKGDQGIQGPIGPTGGAGPLDDLTDVIVGTPATGDHLEFNGTNWVSATPSGGGGAIAIDDLTDVVEGVPSSGDLLEFNGTNWVSVTPLNNQSFSTFSAQTGTSSIPGDNTTPQSTEGTQVWSGTFTLTNASNHVLFSVSSTLGIDGGDFGAAVVTVFRDSVCIGAAAIAADSKEGGDVNAPLHIKVKDNPGDTSLHTYSVRCGRTSGGTWYIGRATGYTLGGAMASSSTVHIQEITP